MMHLTWSTPPASMRHLFTPLVRTKAHTVQRAAEECVEQAKARQRAEEPIYICIQNFGHGPRVMKNEELDLARGHERLAVAVWRAWFSWFLHVYKDEGGPKPDGFVFDYERVPLRQREDRMDEAAYSQIIDAYGHIPITNWNGGYVHEGTVVYSPFHDVEDAKIAAAIRRVGVDNVWPWVRYPGTHRRRHPPTPTPLPEIQERFRRLVKAGITTFQWWGPAETYQGMWTDMQAMVEPYMESGVDPEDEEVA